MNPHSSRQTRHRIQWWIFRVFAAWAIIAIVFGIYAWLFAWRQLAPYSPQTSGMESFQDLILDHKAYGKKSDAHDRPFIVELTTPHAGSILLYGAEHTKDPNNPQIKDMERRWTDFKPTVALCESRLGVLFPGLMDPVRTFAEPGRVHALARQHGIPTFTWEPPLKKQIEHLLKDYTKEQVALRFILTPYFSNLRFGRPQDPDAMVASTLKKRSHWPGIENTFEQIEDLQSAWDRYYPRGPDWRTVSDQHALPGFLNDMDANVVRDRHFFAVLMDLINKGERVFAVAGSSHAVKLEPALKAALNQTVPRLQNPPKITE